MSDKKSKEGQPTEEAAPTPELVEEIPTLIELKVTVVEPVENRSIGENFILDGELYQVDQIEEEWVAASFLENSSDGSGKRKAWQRPVLKGTMVEPK